MSRLIVKKTLNDYFQLTVETRKEKTNLCEGILLVVCAVSHYNKLEISHETGTKLTKPSESNKGGSMKLNH